MKKNTKDMMQPERKITNWTLAVLALSLLIQHTGTGPVCADDSVKGDSLLKGSAIIETTQWKRYYEAGIKALADRNFGQAEKLLDKSISESKKRGGENEQMLASRIALAKVYIGTWNYVDAERLFTISQSLAEKLKGVDSLEEADCLNGLAWIYTGKQKFAKAETMAKQSVAIREKQLGQHSPEVAQSLYTLGKCLDKQGWVDQAEPFYRRSITILQNNAGANDLLLADVMEDCAKLDYKQGTKDEAADLFSKSAAIKEQYVDYSKPIFLKGGVVMNWSDGSPRCQRLDEQDRTVKYMTANGLRVATAIHDNGVRLNVMVSLTNNSNQPIPVGVGPVKLFVRKPKQKELFRLDPNVIAGVIEDKAASAASWNRFLGDMQRQRIISTWSGGGIGPYWGAWGIPYSQWGTTVWDVPDYAARQAYYAKAASIEAQGMAAGNALRSTQLQPQILPAGQSRTGLVYFEEMPFDEAYLQVIVGNTIFEFPYSLSGKL